MQGDPAFFEIGVPDDGRAQVFYSKLFDWTFPSFGDGGQVSVETPTIRGGLHGQDPESRIELYFTVPDIDAAVIAVRELGGQAEDARPEEPGFGRFTSCRDDQGVRFGLRQPAR